MASKLVTDRERSSTGVSTFLLTHATRAEEGVRRSVPEPHRAVGIATVFQALAAWLTGAVLAMLRADQANEAALADDALPRDRRDRAWSALRSGVVAFRGVIAANHGDVALKQLGLWDPCPQDYLGTLAYARDLVALLAGPPVLPPPKQTSAAPDLTRARAEIDALRAALETELAAVAANEAHNAATLAEKTQAMTEHDRVRRAVLDTAGGLFDAAGLPALSEELRAIVRAPSPSAEPTPEPTPPAAPTNGAPAAS